MLGDGQNVTLTDIHERSSLTVKELVVVPNIVNAMKWQIEGTKFKKIKVE